MLRIVIAVDTKATNIYLRMANRMELSAKNTLRTHKQSLNKSTLSIFVQVG
jgi:hypothetical protein